MGKELAIKPMNFEPDTLNNRDQIPEINSAKALDLIHTVLTHWARWDNEYDPVIASLWIASTYIRDDKGKLMANAHARLGAIADMGSGKTRIMKLIRAMSYNPTGIVKAPVTAPGVKAALADNRTVFLDEIDRQVGRGMAHLDLQSIISAYERDTGSLNARGGYNEEDIFGALMWAAKPRIETGTNGYVDDLFERSFIIRPRKHDDPCDQIPDLNNEFRSVTEIVTMVMTRWAESIRWIEERNGNSIVDPIHSVPKRLRARQREISLFLLAIADRAVNPQIIRDTGSDTRWAIRAREAVMAILMGNGSDHDSNDMINDASESMAQMRRKK